MGGQKPAAVDVVGGIYEAALEPELWPPALKNMAAHLGAASATAIAIDVRAREVGFAALHNIEARHLDDYRRHYVRIDPWNDYLRGQAPGRPIVSQAAMDDDDFARTAFCNDFLRPQDMFHAMGGFVLRRGPLAFLCGVQRPRAAGGFAPQEVARMAALFPHLARAARIHRRMTLAGGLGQGLTAALERLPCAALLAAADGSVPWMNRAAEALLRRGDGLRLREGRLEAAANGATSQALRRLIAGAPAAEKNGHGGAGAGGRAADAGGNLAIPRGEGRRPLAALVTPLTGAAADRLSGAAPDLALDLARPAALILVSDPDCAVRMPAERLARALGLTPAEARIAAALGAGSSIAAYAETAQLSINTARWTLKQAMAKLGAHRQTDLVRQVIAATGAGAGEAAR